MKDGGGPGRRIVVLQHVPFEGPEAIAGWARRRGHVLEVRRLFDGEPLPGLDEWDGLVAMGGPMSANDGARHGWLEPERALLARAIEAQRAVLGICLGAQILARAAGARVHPAREKEIGWLPVELLPAARQSLLAPLPSPCVPFHWHGETFERPPGAMSLARSERCPEQAYQLGPAALGLQFHLEATPAGVDSLLRHCADALEPPGAGVQAAERMRGEAADRATALEEPLHAILDGWIVAGRGR